MLLITLLEIRVEFLSAFKVEFCVWDGFKSQREEVLTCGNF